MKKILLLTLLVLLLGGGCASNKACCPAEDSVIMLMTPFGPVPGVVEKDAFSEKYRGDSWMTLDEVKRRKKQAPKTKTPDGGKI